MTPVSKFVVPVHWYWWAPDQAKNKPELFGAESIDGQQFWQWQKQFGRQVATNNINILKLEKFQPDKLPALYGADFRTGTVTWLTVCLRFISMLIVSLKCQRLITVSSELRRTCLFECLIQLRRTELCSIWLQSKQSRNPSFVFQQPCYYNLRGGRQFLFFVPKVSRATA